MSVFDGRLQFAQAIFTGIDYALYLRHNTHQPLTPFILTLKNGQITHRQQADGHNPEEALNQLAQQLEQPFDQVIMCMEVKVGHAEGPQHDAVMVKAFDAGEPLGMLFGQRFVAPETGQPLSRVGRATLFGTEVPSPLPITAQPARQPGPSLITAAASPREDGTSKQVITAGHLNTSLLAHDLLNYTRDILEAQGINFSGELEINLVPYAPIGAFEQWLFTSLTERIQSQSAAKAWERKQGRSVIVTLNLP